MFMTVYEHKKYCAWCVAWHDKENLRCPDCKRMLRTKARGRREVRVLKKNCERCNVEIDYYRGGIPKYCLKCSWIKQSEYGLIYYRKHYNPHPKPKFTEKQLYLDLCSKGVKLSNWAKYGYKNKKGFFAALSAQKRRKGLQIQKTQIIIYKIKKPKSDTNKKSETAMTIANE